jgi:hypothetical protein
MIRAFKFYEEIVVESQEEVISECSQYNKEPLNWMAKENSLGRTHVLADVGSCLVHQLKSW